MSNKRRNSTMVSNEEEMEEHSKVMERMPSNKQVKKRGRIPDPKQNKQTD